MNIKELILNLRHDDGCSTTRDVELRAEAADEIERLGTVLYNLWNYSQPNDGPGVCGMAGRAKDALGDWEPDQS